MVLIMQYYVHLITSGASGTNSRLYYNSKGSHADDDINLGNLFYHGAAGHESRCLIGQDLKYAISVI
jgi:hypothetical protein